MAFALTYYQIAALQEMQIPVWQLQSELAKQPADTPVAEAKVNSEPVSQDTARSHLQRLKDSVSGKPAATQPADVPPPLQDVTAQQAPQFFADLKVALQGLDIAKVPPVKIGAPVAASTTAITLPVAPDKLTSQHKIQLWQALCALS